MQPEIRAYSKQVLQAIADLGEGWHKRIDIARSLGRLEHDPELHYALWELFESDYIERWGWHWHYRIAETAVAALRDGRPLPAKEMPNEYRFPVILSRTFDFPLAHVGTMDDTRYAVHDWLTWVTGDRKAVRKVWYNFQQQMQIANQMSFSKGHLDQKSGTKLNSVCVLKTHTESYKPDPVLKTRSEKQSVLSKDGLITLHDYVASDGKTYQRPFVPEAMLYQIVDYMRPTKNSPRVQGVKEIIRRYRDQAVLFRHRVYLAADNCPQFRGFLSEFADLHPGQVSLQIGSGQ